MVNESDPTGERCLWEVGLKEVELEFMANAGFSTHCLWNGAEPNECLQRVFEISEMKGYAPFLKKLF